MNTTTAPRTVTVRDVLDRVAGLTGSLAVDTARREAERELPYGSMDAVRASAIGCLRVPAAYGGPGASLVDVFQTVVDLAEADSNVAQALRPHFGFLEKLISDGGEADRERWFTAALAGELFGNATGETAAKHPGDIHAALVPDGDHYRLSGTKYYSTGSLFADWVVVAAKNHLDQRVRVVLPRDRPGLRLLDDWDGMGQRMTASGTTELEDVVVYPREVIVDEAVGVRRTHLGAYHQLYLAAVETGIAKNAVRDAIGYARDRARAVRHSGVDQAVQDPFVQHTVGEMAALGYGAEATVLRAAAAIDRALAGPRGEDGVAGDEPALADAATEVAQAQVVAAQAALRAAERLYDVGGASATRREFNFDRHWRNARTLVSHNPIAHKARVVGDYLLNAEPPPLTGFF
ncbi:acyl-CoA dehydrogenase [Streptomyces himastatinicus ATCC 53653]|uniref:Acyl-CoA dehydrogenase n=1 Tax=Streptomyces himastatinicus ATCC 53653 TaxID=457427 RepID=D9W814_9ACTN|nr:acyl-CoA dehydrogenase family protein [Streptomyces himastatinicus]EFL20548.1 acyl-CoA dehydrogenase [Streptomyces himastatinicus ATCC 53653]